MAQLKAGAASVAVCLGDDCFPNAESVAKHDDVYVRLVILESERRFAILEADMPSMFPSEIQYCKQLLKELAGVQPKDSWITVSHSFSSPHTWPLETTEQRDTVRPAVIDQNPQIREATQRINQAYKDAYRSAIDLAMADLREARVGFGVGSCNINVNRNMYTVDGYWQGVNYDGFVDHSLSVVRFNDQSGRPIAILYNYSMQIACAAGNIKEYGGRVTSSDIVGVSSRYVEDAYGGCTALFLCGATGDQSSLFKINYTETDLDGHYREVSLGAAGFSVLEAQGLALGNAVMLTAQKISCEDSSPVIRTADRVYTCSCRKRDANMSRLRPTHSLTSIPDGTRDLKVSTMIIGDIALVGLLPEIDAITLVEIRTHSPYVKTLVSSFVNGNAKSMPQRKSYEEAHRTALNSPFMAGSAELTRDVALELLKDLKNS